MENLKKRKSSENGFIKPSKKQKVQKFEEIINSNEAKIFYLKNFLSKEESKQFYNSLKSKANWKQEDLIIFGKKVKPPRLICSYGDDGLTYFYSGKNERALPWLDELTCIRDKVIETMKTLLNEEYSPNFALLNFYRDGRDYIGPHSDDESDLVKGSYIASVSLGADRNFVFQHKKRDEKIKIKIENASLLLMGGNTQQFYKHELPKRMKIKEGRINITFRIVKKK